MIKKIDKNLSHVQAFIIIDELKLRIKEIDPGARVKNQAEQAEEIYLEGKINYFKEIAAVNCKQTYDDPYVHEVNDSDYINPWLIWATHRRQIRLVRQEIVTNNNYTLGRANIIIEKFKKLENEIEARSGVNKLKEELEQLETRIFDIKKTLC